MERTLAASSPSSMAPASLFVQWEEVFLLNEKGKKEVRYYLKRRDGNLDLAVVGKERSSSRMSYYYALRNRSLLLSLAPSSSLHKLRSRREVLDWLSSVVPDFQSNESSAMVDGLLANKGDCDTKRGMHKDFHIKQMDHPSKEFSWFGSPWTCRKRRKHYQSFSRNGIKISVHDFVYVLAEENKRLVAYLEDLYEDSRGNKMVVVRWFHKIDEVGVIMPHNINDREIFFSLCLQNLSIECIDGLATVLSPQHFEKFRNEATHTLLEPFLCHRQVDNDDVKPFDITQVQGYWKQEILRYMYTMSPMKPQVKPDADGVKVEGDEDDDSIRTRPRKRHRGKLNQRDDGKKVRDVAGVDLQKFSAWLSSVHSSKTVNCGSKTSGSNASLSGKDPTNQRPDQHFAVGCHVEVLSQDSGIRGCWFRAIILKRHKDKVKLQYQDIQDAADESKKLEEWVPGSRVAVHDELGFRISGRTTVRPCPSPNQGKVSWVCKVGTAVDAWWHDGWWEGIVLCKESENRIHVYFPGERRTSIFGYAGLRRSQEWVQNRWKRIKERSDLATSISSCSGNREDQCKVSDGCNHPDQMVICSNGELANNGHVDNIPYQNGCKKSSPCLSSQDDRGKGVGAVADLSKDDFLTQLKWKASRKRKHSRDSMWRRKSMGSKQYCNGDSSNCTPEDVGSLGFGSFVVPKALMVDHENCKYRGDSLLSSSIPVASMVLSR